MEGNNLNVRAGWSTRTPDGGMERVGKGLCLCSGSVTAKEGKVGDKESEGKAREGLVRCGASVAITWVGNSGVPPSERGPSQCDVTVNVERLRVRRGLNARPAWWIRPFLRAGLVLMPLGAEGQLWGTSCVSLRGCNNVNKRSPPAASSVWHQCTLYPHPVHSKTKAFPSPFHLCLASVYSILPSKCSVDTSPPDCLPWLLMRFLGGRSL